MKKHIIKIEIIERYGEKRECEMHVEGDPRELSQALLAGMQEIEKLRLIVMEAILNGVQGNQREIIESINIHEN